MVKRVVNISIGSLTYYVIGLSCAHLKAAKFIYSSCKQAKKVMQEKGDGITQLED